MPSRAGAALNIDRDRLARPLTSLALRNESAVLIAARATSHTEVARRLGLPKQTFQDWRDDNLKDALLIIASYGLKLVPFEDEAYSSADIAAMAHLAQKGIVAIKPIRLNGGVVVDDEDTIPGVLGQVD